MNAERPLDTIIANRRWLYRYEPFPHVVAESVFIDSVAAELDQAFIQILDRGLDQPGRALTHMGRYDSYGLSLQPGEPSPFALFLSRAWHDLVAASAGIAATGYVHAGLHYHTPGSRNGFVHNDLNPVWFAEYDSVDGIRLARDEIVAYTTGRVHQAGVNVINCARGVALIYFLNNPRWAPGDGGELGLYRCLSDPPGKPAAAVPPKSNSLVLFECTPYSFHGFVTSSHKPRSSLIMWLHRPKADVIAQWGEGALTPFVNHPE